MLYFTVSTGDQAWKPPPDGGCPHNILTSQHPASPQARAGTGDTPPLRAESSFLEQL